MNIEKLAVKTEKLAASLIFASLIGQFNRPV
jgi:hypothetical protein